MSLSDSRIPALGAKAAPKAACDAALGSIIIGVVSLVEYFSK